MTFDHNFCYFILLFSFLFFKQRREKGKLIAKVVVKSQAFMLDHSVSLILWLVKNIKLRIGLIYKGRGIRKHFATLHNFTRQYSMKLVLLVLSPDIVSWKLPFQNIVSKNNSSWWVPKCHENIHIFLFFESLFVLEGEKKRKGCSFPWHFGTYHSSLFLKESSEVSIVLQNVIQNDEFKILINFTFLTIKIAFQIYTLKL